MGHWTVFCAITHAPIRGRCVGIWTKPNKYDDPYSHENIASIFYRGVYDTYGRIEYDKDQNFVNLIDPKDDEDGPSMFIMESVFDEMLSFGISNFGHGVGDGSAFSESDLTGFNLKKLGFRLLEEKSADERYKHIYVHDSEPDKQIWSDDTWIRVKLKNGKLKEHIYDWKSFAKLFPEVDYSYLKNTWYELNVIETTYEAFRKTIIRWEEKDLHIREFPENKELKNNIDFLIKSWKDQLCNNMGIDASIIPHMADEDYRKELAKVFRVRGFMQANNIKLGQRFASGPQDGNDEAFKKLKHLFDIARKTLRE